MPLLRNDNRYACLEVEEIDDTLETPKPPVMPKNPPTPRIKRPNWEKRLPREFTLATTPSNRSLNLPIQLQTTDTQLTKSTKALLDCGATGLFMGKDFTQRENINTKKLSTPIPVRNVDGTPNEAGPITEVVDIILRYKGHSERAVFAVTAIGQEDVILGLPWLKEHNPEVDWRTEEVKMSRCPARCTTCRDELRQERHEQRVHQERIARCRTGPMPHPHVTMEEVEEEEDEEDLFTHNDLPDLQEDSDDEEEEEDEQLEKGDRVYTVDLTPNAEDIRAGGNFSQRLAEAAHKNEKKKDFRDAVPDYLHDFQDIFAEESWSSLPERKIWDHAIELTEDAKVSNCKVYPMSRSEQTELDAYIDEHLLTGRIRPSKSPMASPCFFIKKKDGKLRFVQDYRKLNAMTVKNRYPLPLIPELVEKLRGAKYFTKLDVRWGYQNIRIKEGDEWKAAFRCNRGLFEPLVMLYGMTNSPATFQTMMNDIFKDLISRGVVCVYIDDILIFTKDLEEHRRVVREVLDILRKHKLFLRHDKCEFERTRIEYLGLIISDGKVEMDPVKVAGVAEWPTPKSKKEVQQFVGFVNFYRRFILDFSHIARPLYDITGNAPWKWEKEQQQAFEELRRRVTSAPVLILPTDSDPFRIEADSSDFATGAVLSQYSREDDKWHPVAFLSKSLSAVECNYEIHDKEMLAIIRALEEWRHFAEGAHHKVEIWTDHRNLEYFMTAQKLNRRQARYSLYLSRFDFTLHHRPGRSMGKPDALSRRSDHGDGKQDNEDIVLLKPELFAIRALEGLTVEGEEKEIVREIRKRNREGEVEMQVTAAVKELKKGNRRSMRGEEWKTQDGLILFRDRIYVPKNAELRRRIVAQHHDSHIAGHPGRWKTLELVSRSYWWPQMSRYIGQYCSTCDLCLRTKAQRHRPFGELQPLEIPSERWKTISVDFIVELPEAHGYDAVMVSVDSAGKRGHFIPTHTTVTAQGAAELFLRNVWKLHGLPDNIVSDRGPQFIAEFTRELYRLLSIKMSPSTAYHPQSDGQTERLNQELEQYVRLFTNERQDNWDELLPLAEFSYNNHIHSATQHTPFILDTGRHPRMGFEPNAEPSPKETANEFVDRMKSTLDEARAALQKSKDDMARYYNRRREPTPVFEPGERVYLDSSDINTTRPSRKLSHRFLGPYPVVRAVGKNAYRLRLPYSMRRLHPVFNVVKLLRAPKDPIVGRRPQPPPDPQIIDGEPEYEVEAILDSRRFRNRLQFLVSWKGYGYEENTWTDENDVHAPDLVREFYRKNPGAPRRIRAVRFGKLPFRPARVVTSPRGGSDVRGINAELRTPKSDRPS